MFTPRKNRNLRKKIDVDDEESAEAPDVSSTIAPAETTAVTPKKVKKKTTSTVLSFGDEEQGSEDAFKVKKSAASRRLILNKGRDDAISDQPTITSRATVGNSTSYSKEALEELRKSTLSTTPSSRHHGASENAFEETPQIPRGATTIIPDAQTIHLAKKKREQMRLRNDLEEEEFVSLIGGDDNTIVEVKDTRLVREEDDDMDDGEADLEKVMGDKLELGAKAQRQAEKLKRNARKELIDMDEDEEDQEETREWEMQQIRNAGIVNAGSKSKSRSTPEHRGVIFPAVTQIPNIAKVRSRIHGYLENLKEQHSQHTKQLEQIRREEAEIILRSADAEEAMTNASLRYTFFQELRSYCRNLAAFFEAKFPELEAIEQEYRSMLSDRTKLVVERRRLDLEDDLAEFANVVDDESAGKGRKDDVPPEVDEFGRSVGVDPLAVRKRRRAERERRRTQRQQSKQSQHLEGSKEVKDHEGLETDDELGAGDERELGDAVMELENRRTTIFQEVGSEFRSIEAVKKHFQAWKTNYPEDYNKAYGGLLLPLVFDFFVRQETCLWNPLRVERDISEQSWHRTVSAYAIVHPSNNAHSDSEDDREDAEDMDKELMSKVVAKSVCPKITQFIAAGGVDLYSARQTRCLKAILDQLLDYVDKKDNKMDQLLKATLQAILNTAKTHRDQFMEAAQPLTPQHILTAQGHEAKERYLWKTIGLFRNLMLLRRFVPNGSMDTQVVDGLLHDCILRLLEGDDKDNVAKYQMIFQALPHDIRSQERHNIIDRMAQTL
ncbi:MAG: nineteen complex-related protein 2-domain-containing protein [Benniella sp.]|nr:MAG: nineteen complex-related protein 2-domain-containing protein [Benniella sp.]